MIKKIYKKLIKEWLKLSQKRRIFYASVLSILLIIIIAPFLAKANLGSAIASILGYVIAQIITFLSKIITLELNILVNFAKFNNFLGVTAVREGWRLVRDVCNMFFILILLVIAFATILKIESYAYKKWLGKLVIAAILINFSKTITGLLIGFSQVAMLTFVSAFKDAVAGNLASGLHLNEMMSASADGEVGKFADNNDNLDAGAVFGALLLALVLLTVFVVVMLIMIVILVGRIVTLWVLVILSPVAFLLQASPFGTKYAKQWWQELGKNLVAGPILAFFLWLAFLTIQRSSGNVVESMENTNTMNEDGAAFSSDQEFLSGISSTSALMDYIVVIALLLAAIKITQEMGVIGSSFAGKMQQGMSKLATKALMHPAKEIGYGFSSADRWISRKTSGIIGFHGMKWKREEKEAHRAEAADYDRKQFTKNAGALVKKSPRWGAIVGGGIKEYHDAYAGPRGVFRQLKDVVTGRSTVKEYKEANEETERKTKNASKYKEKNDERVNHGNKNDFKDEMEKELKIVLDLEAEVKKAELAGDDKSSDEVTKGSYDTKKAKLKAAKANLGQAIKNATFINDTAMTGDIEGGNGGQNGAVLKRMIREELAEKNDGFDKSKGLEEESMDAEDLTPTEKTKNKKAITDKYTALRAVAQAEIEEKYAPVLNSIPQGTANTNLTKALKDKRDFELKEADEQHDSRIATIEKGDHKRGVKKKMLSDAEDDYKKQKQEIQDNSDYHNYRNYGENVKKEAAIATDIVNFKEKYKLADKDKITNERVAIGKNHDLKTRKKGAIDGLGRRTKIEYKFDEEKKEITKKQNENTNAINRQLESIKLGSSLGFKNKTGTIAGAIAELGPAIASAVDPKTKKEYQRTLKELETLTTQEKIVESANNDLDREIKVKIDNAVQDSSRREGNKSFNKTLQSLSGATEKVSEKSLKRVPISSLSARSASRSLIEDKKKELIGMDSNEELIAYLRKAMRDKDKHRTIALMEKMSADGNDNEFLNAITDNDGKKYESNAIGTHKFVQEQLIGKMGMGEQDALSVQNDMSYINEKVGHWETARTVRVSSDGVLRSSVKDLGNGKYDDTEHALECFAEVSKKQSRDVLRSLNRLAYGGEQVRADGSGRDFKFSNLGKMVVTMLNGDTELMGKRADEMNINASQNFMNPLAVGELEKLVGKGSIFFKTANKVSGVATGVRADYETIYRLLKEKGNWN